MFQQWTDNARGVISHLIIIISPVLFINTYQLYMVKVQLNCILYCNSLEVSKHLWKSEWQSGNVLWLVENLNISEEKCSIHLTDEIIFCWNKWRKVLLVSLSIFVQHVCGRSTSLKIKESAPIAQTRRYRK